MTTRLQQERFGLFEPAWDFLLEATSVWGDQNTIPKQKTGHTQKGTLEPLGGLRSSGAYFRDLPNFGKRLNRRHVPDQDG